MRRFGLTLLVFALSWIGSAVLHAADPSRPNIILILADDLGYGDVGCYGQKRIRTPNIDGLAKAGVRFTDFYAGCTVCAPSRCVLMTGRHMGHAWIRGNAGRQDPERQTLRDQDVTMAEVLKGAGYATALCGKWGLGDEGSVGQPTRQGFDYFYGYLNQFHAHNYYAAYLFENEQRVPLKNVVPGEGAFGSGVASERVEYSADLITAKALAWVEKHKDQPFFLYYAPTLPHANNEGGKNGMEVPDLGEYANTDWPPQQKAHAAMISRLDADIGKLLKLLDDLKLADNTLVLFSSDNGPHREGGNDPDFNDSNGPLNGIKRSLTEGGIRVPFIARWPGKIKPSTTSDFIGGFQDLLPTCAEIAGVKEGLPAELDGLSIAPTLIGGAARQTQHDYLYWSFYEGGAGQAVRQGRWKAVQQPLESPIRVYDLTSDVGEQRDLANQHPDVRDKLTAIMKAAYRPNENWQLPFDGAAKAKKKKSN